MSSDRHLKRRRFRSERGASAVEFALVVPLLVVLVFGVIEFGWALSSQVELAHAAREGARAAAVARDGSEADPAARTAAPRFGDDMTVDPTPAGECSDEEISVAVSVDYDSLTGLTGLLPVPAQLNTIGAMRCGG